MPFISMFLLFFFLSLYCNICTAAPLSVKDAAEREFEELNHQIKRLGKWNGVSRDRLLKESHHGGALVTKADGDPVDVVLRRTRALLTLFLVKKEISSEILNRFKTELSSLSAKEQATSSPAERRKIYHQICALRRQIAFSNPLLNFDSIVCMLEQPGDDRIIEQARASWGNHVKGGGPLIISNYKTHVQIQKPIENIAVTEGPWKGQKITGYFSGLELSFDAKTLAFAATTHSDVWRIFTYHFPTRRLVQLTDGPEDDFDPCFLPSGRIVFVSTRRGGMGRCLLPEKARTYTLHSMKQDGSDIVPMSFHETNEWQPSVDNDGMVVYTRWDYADRWWASGHHLWLTYPDGRDPRNYHGNYPLPHSAFEQDWQPSEYGQKTTGHLGKGRHQRPDVEIAFRAVPGSQKFVATAVGHHEGFSGSLILVDRRIEDDGKMSQVKRITPEYQFPEVENNSPYAYGTPWPLSEDFYLVNFWSGLYLLDKFGNRELIYDDDSWKFRLRAPFPLKPRKKPRVIPVQTWQGERHGLPDHKRATIGVLNVNIGDMPLPKGTKVKEMRIIQFIPQMRTKIDRKNISWISVFDESLGRIPLGVVPVEEDGSVYCEAPVNKALYFQLLDENGMAVHSMRSATYVHPGEQMVCVGCHESKWEAIPSIASPKAFQRPPSKIIPEVSSGIFPYNYHKLVKEPVFDKRCVSCHKKEGGPDMSYKSLAKFNLLFGLPGEIGMDLKGIGGSRTTPGKFGAHASGLMKSLNTKDYHKGIELTKEELRRITLWLDLNSNELGWISNDMKPIEDMRAGKDVWPPIDVDPKNPLGTEQDFPSVFTHKGPANVTLTSSIHARPNPFRRTTRLTVHISLPNNDKGRFSLYSPDGRLVYSTDIQTDETGQWFMVLGADSNFRIPSGLSIAKIVFPNLAQSIRLFHLPE